jgi:DNA segregation ATPase FtsK/SpoIIIE-like protein
MKSTAHNTFGIAGQPITSPLGSPIMARDGNSFTPQYGSPNGGNSGGSQHNGGSTSARTPNPASNQGKKSQQSSQQSPSQQQPQSAPPQGQQQGSPKPSGNAPKPEGNPYVQAIIGFLMQYKREISALMLAVCGAALLLALVSYSPEDRANARVSLANAQANAQVSTEEALANSRNSSASRTNTINRANTPLQGEEYVVKNWLGYAGASLSHFIYNYTVGYAALAFPVLMFLWSGAILRRSYSDKLLLGTALALVGTAIFASYAGVLQLVPWMPTMRPEWSGSVGQFIARMLWQVIGAVGAFIVLTAALVATLFTALDLNIEKTIARFNEEKSRFGAWQSKKTTDIAQSVRESMNDVPSGAPIVANVSESFVESDATFNASNEEVFTDSVIADDEISKAMFGTVTEAPKSVSYIMDDEVLSAKTEKSTPKPASTLADAEEPARILQRNTESTNLEQHIIPSIRRELINKYSDDSNEAASEVLSARASSLPTLPQQRMNAALQASPTISVSAPQTTIHAPSFAYPAQASITFVEKKNDEDEINDEGQGIKDKSEEVFMTGTPVVTAPNGLMTNPPMTNDRVASHVTTDDLLAERRNIQHLTGLMAEQVAGEVAEKVAQNIAQNVASGVAQGVAAEVAERMLDQMRQQMREEMQAEFAGRVEQRVQEQIQEHLQEQATKRIAEETASAHSEEKSPEIRMNIRNANSLDVIAKPLFMAQNNLDEEIDYTPPHLGLLVPQEPVSTVDEAELQEKARIMQAKLSTFKIEIENLNVTPGPVVTQYEFVPAAGVKVAQIENLADDIALALKARGIRIIAPVPGRGTVAVEIPNQKATAVRFSSIVDTAEFQDAAQRLPLALGKTINGDVYAADLAKMPHLLIAGATGSGKSVGINSIIASLLYKMHPRDLKFVIIDPKKVEMSQYRSLANHFLAVCPDIDEKIITNPQNAVIALKSVVAEMERRYDVLAKVGQRNIVDYNQKVREGRYKDTSEVVHSELPYIVVIVDELADLMMTASRDVEEPICRLAQLARAVGIHLVVATQRPSVDVVTGLIKANFPARIAYQVSSKIDSRTILDTNGAEHLLGNGDMLFTPGGAGKPMRLQNSYLSTDEVERICDHISDQQGYSQPYFLPSVSEKTQKTSSGSSDDDRDELFEEAARIIVRHQQCSVSLLQRRMKIGYSRAARIVDQLEEAGIVGPFDGSKGRAILLESEADLDGIL